MVYFKNNYENVENYLHVGVCELLLEKQGSGMKISKFQEDKQ